MEYILLAAAGMIGGHALWEVMRRLSDWWTERKVEKILAELRVENRHKDVVLVGTLEMEDTGITADWTEEEVNNWATEQLQMLDVDDFEWTALRITKEEEYED